MNGIRLSPENIGEQLFRFGYLYEQLPPCFTAESFAENFADIIDCLADKAPITAPLQITMYKNGTSRRTVSIPNPWSFAFTVSVFSSNWGHCIRFAKSACSHSPITIMSEYGLTMFGNHVDEVVNAERLRDFLGLVSSFVSNVKDRILLSLGKPYKLTVDIQAFYDSLYTHSLGWAACGKAEVKWWLSLSRREKRDHPEQKPADYDLADEFDKSIRAQKSNQTNGIVTGPYTSRIYSEMLLGRIDRLLHDRGLSDYRRYVDDYSFYFHSIEEAERGRVTVEGILNEFGLNINASKTRIERYPFDVFDNMKSRFNDAYEARGVHGLLNEAAIADREGSKGAFKYALKMLRSKADISKCEDIDIPMLINIGLSRPNCAMYALGLLKKRNDLPGLEELESTLNDLLYESTERGLEQEALYALYYCRELGVPLSSRNIVKTLDEGNDLCKIIALDLVTNRMDLIIDDDDSDVNDAMRRLEESLDGERFRDSHWLLMYECLNYGFLHVEPDEGEVADLMKDLARMGVTFYEGHASPSFLWVADTNALE